MVEQTCEFCGYGSQLGAVQEYHIIPSEITEHAATPRLQVMRMCCNCRRELDAWYSAKVAKMVYDTKMLQFRARTSGEMVEEYHSVFDGFANYKKNQSKVKRT